MIWPPFSSYAHMAQTSTSVYSYTKMKTRTGFLYIKWHWMYSKFCFTRHLNLLYSFSRQIKIIIRWLWMNNAYNNDFFSALFQNLSYTVRLIWCYIQIRILLRFIRDSLLVAKKSILSQIFNFFKSSSTRCNKYKTLKKMTKDKTHYIFPISPYLFSN